jgi:RimJ/RimL family protein N-acetyltransferase
MPALTIRPATELDSRDLFEWRNDPQTRVVSISTDEVPWEDHYRWFTASLSNQRRQIYMCCTVIDGSSDSIGVVRFDIDESLTEAEVSINLNPRVRGRGLGTQTLLAGIAEFESDRPSVMRLTAQIRDSNEASVAIFRKAGFNLKHSNSGLGQFVRQV